MGTVALRVAHKWPTKMIKRLTTTSIETLPPGEYGDPAVPGLRLRIRADRHGRRRQAWLLRYQLNGKRTHIRVGRGLGLAEARTAAIEARELMRRGIDPHDAQPRKRATPRLTGATPAPGTEAPAPHSVATLAAEYLRLHVGKRRKRPEYVERFLDADVLPKWGTRDARTIRPREVVELLDGIVERGSPTMANRGAGVLSQMFRFGVHRAIVDASPVQLLYRPGGLEKPRERALTELELAAFVSKGDELMRFQTGGTGRTPRHAHALRLLLLTGQRRGELALAQWSDVTLTGKAPTWRIPAENSKTGVPHLVPLSSAAVCEFQALHKYANGSAYVLPRDDGKAAADPKLLTRAVARNKKRFQAIGIAPFTVHDLRRTCRTGLARLGVRADIAERVLNHKQPGMTGVYDQHDYQAEMRAALERWAAHLATLENEPAPLVAEAPKARKRKR